MICTLSWSSFSRAAAAACFATTLAACAASPTPYQAESDGGGYADQQLESDRYRVTFEGNDATSREQVEDFALFRAAELTLQTGNDYFKVVSREVEPVLGSSRGVSPSIGLGVGGGGGNFGLGLSTFFGGGRGTYGHVSYLDIIVYKGEKPEGDLEAYGALDVIEQLKPAVVGSAEE